MNFLLDIARCPLIPQCLSEKSGASPCDEIVRSQHAKRLDDLQLPEPWSGHLETAPILFVSSNPSIGKSRGEYPQWNWSDTVITDFFENRFEKWIRDGKYVRRADGSYRRATAYWASVRLRAQEILGEEPRPGIDYALTEIVHCKSKHEEGVAAASEICTSRYLSQVLTLSGARAIVALGKVAQSTLVRTFGIPNRAQLYGPTRLGERERMVCFLPHPNARMPRTFATVLKPHQMQTLRSFVHSHS